MGAYPSKASSSNAKIPMIATIADMAFTHDKLIIAKPFG
jgi:hypothetical protein